MQNKSANGTDMANLPVREVMLSPFIQEGRDSEPNAPRHPPATIGTCPVVTVLFNLAAAALPISQ